LLFALAIVAGAGSFSDSHSDGSLNGWEIVGERNWIESAWQILPAQGNASKGILLHEGTADNDGELTVTLRPDEWNGHRGGVVFRYTSPTSFYFLGIRPANPYEPHVYFCKGDLDNCAPLGEKNLVLGSEVQLRLVMQGSEFKVYLNGMLATTIVDDSCPNGKMGYAHSGEWNRLCTFDAITWTATQTSSSSTEISSSSELYSSSSSALSSSSIAYSSSSVQVTENYQPSVFVTTIGADRNWYAKAITLRNMGADTLPAGTQMGWHYVWSDHGSMTHPELDYASQTGTTLQLEERDDYSGTIWITLTQAIAPNGSAIAHLRMHTEDYSLLDRTNDPSWNGIYTVRINGQDYLNAVPRQPFPTPIKQEAQVETRITQHSTNTLGLTFVVKNTGLVPLRKVRFSWFADTLPQEQALTSELDYSASGRDNDTSYDFIRRSSAVYSSTCRRIHCIWSHQGSSIAHPFSTMGGCEFFRRLVLAWCINIAWESTNSRDIGWLVAIWQLPRSH